MQTKGNVSVLVMFIMIATSLMGLLAMHFVNQMMQYSGVVHDYYKTYYLTKAGLELGLAEANVRGLGFSTQIASGFFAENFSCGDRCEIDAQVVGKATLLKENFWNSSDGCSSENAIHLGIGQQIILPLFSEDSLATHTDNLTVLDSARSSDDWSSEEGSSYTALSKEVIEDLKIILPDSTTTTTSVRMWVLALKKTEHSTVGSYDSNIVYFQLVSLSEESIRDFFWNFFEMYGDISEQYYFYLLIGNAGDQVFNFCVQAHNDPYTSVPTLLSAQRFWIESKASYDRNVMSMEAQYRQALPDIFTNAGEY